MMVLHSPGGSNMEFRLDDLSNSKLKSKSNHALMISKGHFNDGEKKKETDLI